MITENKEYKPNFKLTKSQINSLLSNYEYMGYDEEYAKEDLIDLVSYLNKLPSTLKLYRIICADDISEIDRVYVGSHYSPNKTNLVRNHYGRGSTQSHCFGDKVFLLTVEVDKTKMDVFETLSNNILFPHEEEITLKNIGKGVQIINIEEL
jgi:SUMO ligase MMS21 Smc5/6 complex component